MKYAMLFMRELCLYTLLLIGMLVGLAFTSDCGPTLADRHATAAEASARIGNRAEPLWLAAYRAEGRAAVARAGAEPKARLAALRPVTDRWRTVAVAWETLVHAHGAWATRVDACRGVDGGITAGAQCTALPALEGDFLRELGAWRCAVRALHRPDVDPFPGAATCPDHPPDAGPDVRAALDLLAHRPEGALELRPGMFSGGGTP